MLLGSRQFQLGHPSSKRLVKIIQAVSVRIKLRTNAFISTKQRDVWRSLFASGTYSSGNICSLDLVKGWTDISSRFALAEYGSGDVLLGICGQSMVSCTRL